MKNKQNIKAIANSIVTLEKQLQLGEDVKENQKKIEDIISSLSIEDMLLIDDYIMEEKLLTK